MGNTDSIVKTQEAPAESEDYCYVYTNEMDPIDRWKDNRKHVISKLNEFADELDKIERDVRIAKLAGTSASIVCTAGSVIAGLLAIPTLGATAPVAVGLGIVAGLGGATTAGSLIVKSVKDNELLKETQEAIDSDIRETIKVKSYIESGQRHSDTSLHSAGNDSKYKAISSTATLIGAETLRSALTIGGEAAIVTGKVTTAVAKVGNVAVPVGRVVGPFLGLVILPFDIYTLVTTAVNTNNGKPSAATVEIRKRAQHMQEELDSVENSLQVEQLQHRFAYYFSSAELPYEMEIESGHDIDKLVEGDLIQFERAKGIYSHWAVYIGNKEIIHLDAYEDDFQTKIINLKAIVKKDMLMNVKTGKVRKNNSKDKQLGSVVIPEDIVEQAKALIGLRFYDLLYFNSEHFASFCRYGDGWSSQANILFTVLSLVPFVGKIVNAKRQEEFDKTTKIIKERIRSHLEQ